ncbi:MAG: hypothetical protein K2L81_05655, partial [Muribaculaceae bacterium]|nr:hypothetical protein [Muribaculaceae bacterium]
AVIISTLSLSAKDVEITLSSDPDDAKVFLNGQQVAVTTPAIIRVNAKDAQKTMIFKFVKNGYKSKSVTVSFTKQQLKYNPVVHCQMNKEDPKPVPQTTSDPTVSRSQAKQRVSRETPGKTDMEKTILRWYFDSDPRGARVFWRVISSVPNEVKNTNETYLTTTPIEETRSFNIQGLTYDNSRDVTIEIKVTKRGYEDQVKRFNVRQALDQQEISGFFELVPKESHENPE